MRGGRACGSGRMAGWCGRAGVERSNGSGMDALLGSRTATLVGGVPVARRFPCGGVAPCRVSSVRWWFENWIVDASGWPAVVLAVCCIVSSGPMFGGFGSIVL